MDLIKFDFETLDSLPQNIVISIIRDQIKCNQIKKELKCYFRDKNFENILKRYSHLLHENSDSDVTSENESKKRNRVSYNEHSDIEEINSQVIETTYVLKPLPNGFIKCWIINNMKRRGENLFHVEFNNCSCDTRFTWAQILDYCNGDETEAVNRLILEERPDKPNGLLKKKSKV